MHFIVFLILCFIFYSVISGFLQNLAKNGNFDKKNYENLNFNEAKFIIALVAKVAKSDGRINHEEADLISALLDDLISHFGGGKTERDALKEIFNFEKISNNKAFNIAFEYQKSCKISQSRKLEILNFLFNLAYVDGEFSSAEREILNEICDGFEFNEILKREIFDRFEIFFRARNFGNFGYEKHYENSNGYDDYKSHQKSPYEVLGVSENADFNEIKAKYRELVKKYHPDILMGKGASEQTIQEATKKLQEINEAYEILQKDLKR